MLFHQVEPEEEVLNRRGSNGNNNNNNGNNNEQEGNMRDADTSRSSSAMVRNVEYKI